MDNQQEPNWWGIDVGKEMDDAAFMFGIMRHMPLNTEVVPRMLIVMKWQQEQIKRLSAEIDQLKKRLDANE